MMDKRPSSISNHSSAELYGTSEKQFVDACFELRDELRFNNHSDLGILSDIVVGTNTISKANRFVKSSQMFRNASGHSGWSKKKANSPSLADIEVSLQQQQTTSFESEDDQPRIKVKSSKVANKKNARKSISNWSVQKKSYGDEESSVEGQGKRSSSSTTVVATTTGQRSSSEETRQEDSRSVSHRLSVEDSDGEDKHIFLVRKLVDEKDASKLLSQGYRFAEPVFIAKTMASKLRIPIDWMRQHFIDMQQLADSICGLTQHEWVPSTIEPAPNPTDFKASTKSSVRIGAFILMDESKEMNSMQIAIDKARKYAFPLEQLTYDLPAEAPTELNEVEVNFIKNLQGQSLFEIANLQQTIIEETYQHEVQLPSEQFIRGLERAARRLLDATSYSKALYQTSKLHMDVLDLPPFALTTGPCQLIVFTSFVNTKGAVCAVNHTFTEPMRCIPLKIYKLLSAFITTEAARVYQISTQTYSAPTYLLQQQMYRQQTSGYDQKRITNGEEDVPMDSLSATERTYSNHSGFESPLPTTPTSTTMITDPFSLPPPPRVKRSRFKLTNTILGGSPFDILSPLQDQQPTKNFVSLKNAPLTVLTARDRYWWIDSLVEETIHSNMD